MKLKEESEWSRFGSILRAFLFSSGSATLNIYFNSFVLLIMNHLSEEKQKESFKNKI